MDNIEDEMGTWSQEMKNGRLVTKLIKPKTAPKKKAAKKSKKQ
tara:strand:- start:694 stop:822 length:129 start_codon:yes stop_codon:yes gene_type:complete